MSSVTLDQANRIIAAILKRGAEIGCHAGPQSVVVVEPGRIVKAFQKEDGSSMARFEFALLALFLLAFAKADAGPAAVLVDELDAGQPKSPSKHRKGRMKRFRCFTLK